MRNVKSTICAKAPEYVVVTFSHVLSDAVYSIRRTFSAIAKRNRCAIADRESLAWGIQCTLMFQAASESPNAEATRVRLYKWIIGTAPRLARELNMALASNGQLESDSPILAPWWLLARWIVKYGTVVNIPVNNALAHMTWIPPVPLHVPGWPGIDHPDDREFTAVCLRAVRQVFGLYARLTLRSGNSDQDALEKAFIRLTTEEPFELPSKSAEVVMTSLTGLNLDFLFNADLPGPCYKHGPGSVAECQFSKRFWRKDECATVDDPLFDYLDPRPFRDLSTLDEWSLPPKKAEGSDASKLSAVPKDFRGPRIIAAEPCLHQYVQQAVKSVLYDWLDHCPLSGAIALRHQELNALAALKGSVTKEVDTIDLSDASDYVRWKHITEVMKFLPSTLDAITLLRTRLVKFGDLSQPLTTAFPMGSPLCFPMQSVVYASVLIGEYLERIGVRRTPTARDIRQAVKALKLRVYGDDIIVARDHYDCAVAALTRAGFHPNLAKCCHGDSPFRESCGTDAWNGHDVTPLRPRNLPGGEECGYGTLLADAQNFADNGYIETAMWLCSLASSVSRSPVPCVPAGPRGTGWIVSNLLYQLSDKEFPKARRHAGLQLWAAPVITEVQKLQTRGVPEQVRYRAALRDGAAPLGWKIRDASSYLKKRLAYFYYCPCCVDTTLLRQKGFNG